MSRYSKIGNLGCNNNRSTENWHPAMEIKEEWDPATWLRKKLKPTLDGFGRKHHHALKSTVRHAEKKADAFVAPVKHALDSSGMKEALKKGKQAAHDFGQRLAQNAHKLLGTIDSVLGAIDRAIHNFMCMQGPVVAGVAFMGGLITNAGECAAFGSLIAGVLSWMGGNTPAAIALAAKIGVDAGTMCNIALGVKSAYDAPAFAGDLQAWACSGASKDTKSMIKGTSTPGRKVIPNFMVNSMDVASREFAPYAPWMQSILPQATRRHMCSIAADRCGKGSWGKAVLNSAECAQKATELMAMFTAKQKIVGSNWKDFLIDLKTLIVKCQKAINLYPKTGYTVDQCIGDSQLEWCTRDKFPIKEGEDKRLVCSYGPKTCAAMKKTLEDEGFSSLF